MPPADVLTRQAESARADLTAITNLCGTAKVHLANEVVNNSVYLALWWVSCYR